ncbi:YbfB/YjiJ family MFS transporter [Affinibrenneria salicis]|uniref:YbfB/YjiJ family MFS transporter n=1 Tax=Affinibrenneria salicis TaxID=2590031 RepID=A0A5J5G1K7_9GAMM|nr:MFS transporter [Affinibrenneria salicis]KAA9000541.1 YbfB/YjiJ family MFS transporter [Affinibrenneria salicis]
MQSERSITRPAGLLNTVGVAVILTLYMAIVFGFGLYLFSVLVAYMRKSLDFDIPAVGIITGGAQVSYLMASLFCSHITRRFGGGHVIFVAAFTAGFLLILLSAVQDIWQTGTLLIALGSCAAMVVIPTVSVIGKVVPVVWQSSVNGLISSGTAYGQFATGLIVPFFIHNYDWRTVWMVIGAISVTVAIIGYILLRVLAADAFGPDARKNCSEKQANPDKSQRFIPVAVPRNFLIWVLLALSGIACGPWQNYLASFLGNEQGFSISFIGQLWSIIGVTGLASGFAFGLLADRIGVRIALALSYGILLAAGVLVAIESGTMALRIAAVAFGLSFYAIYGLIPAYITKTSSPETSTAIFAVANVFLGIGTSFGNIGSGYFQSWLGSFQGIYTGVAVIAVVGIILSLILPDERKITRNE